jgi:excisionase family DNA binding protein
VSARDVARAIATNCQGALRLMRLGAKEAWLDGHGNTACAIPGEVVYTVAEVAGLLRVHKSTVYRDVESGRIDAYRVGKGRGTVRIRESAFQEYQRRAAKGVDRQGPPVGLPLRGLHPRHSRRLRGLQEAKQDQPGAHAHDSTAPRGGRLIPARPGTPSRPDPVSFEAWLTAWLLPEAEAAVAVEPAGACHGTPTGRCTTLNEPPVLPSAGMPPASWPAEAHHRKEMG